MPAKGKHRRPKSQRLTRSLAIAGTGGAALAWPLLGATGALAATPHAPSTAHHTQQSGAARTTAAKHKTTTYSVRPHDTLVKIARDHDVKGGWRDVYRANHAVIGDDPGLILPGQRLVIGGTASAATPPSHRSSSGAHASGGSTPPGPAPSAPPSPAQSSPTPSPSGSTASGSDSGYQAPVDGAVLGTPWHQAGSMWASGYHTGQDFIVPSGTPVHAVADGTVVTAGWGGAYGNQVVVQHGDGRYSQYAHMSALKVSAGQRVTKGQEIGVSGATGNVTGPHLHFEIRTTPDYGSDIDPLAYLRSHGVNV